MIELLPSWIVLASAVGSLIILVTKGPDKKAATLMNRFLIAALCFIGGMLLAAMYSRAVGENSQPGIIAVLVAIGTFGSTAIFLAIEKKQRANKTKDKSSL